VGSVFFRFANRNQARAATAQPVQEGLAERWFFPISIIYLCPTLRIGRKRKRAYRANKSIHAPQRVSQHPLHHRQTVRQNQGLLREKRKTVTQTITSIGTLLKEKTA
jgi:hypothetical protein